MGLLDKVKAKVDQAKAEVAGIRYAPSRAERKRDNEKYDQAEAAQKKSQ